MSPPTTPLSLRGLARPGSDRRAGKIEDETDALHAQRGCLPRLPAQRRQAQEKKWKEAKISGMIPSWTLAEVAREWGCELELFP